MTSTAEHRDDEQEEDQAERGERRGLPRGPQALPREEVAAHQRDRLFMAMIEAVNEKGFTGITISELVGRAGISRRSFYEHFDSKEKCLLATFDAAIQLLTSRVLATRDPSRDWELQVQEAIGALFETTIQFPEAARLVCVEVGAAGTPGVERWAGGAERLETYITTGFTQAPGRGTIPEPVAKAFVGAVRKILYSRVQSGPSARTWSAELRDGVPDLAAWICSYYPSPAGVPEAPRELRPARYAGGLAPGTLTALGGLGPRGLPRGEHNLPRGFVVHNQRERIFDAIASLTAAKGYPALGLEDIAGQAAISLQTFYRHFENKGEAFLATYEVGHARAVSVVGEAFAGQPSWVEGVCAGVGALLEFLAAEPAYAHLACVDILIAFPHVAELVDQPNSYAQLLQFGLEGLESPDRPSPIVIEAVVGGIFELLHDYVLRGLTRRLPELAGHASYLALTPFLGSEAAAEAAFTS